MKSHYEFIFFIIHSIVDEHLLVSFLAVVNRMAISMDIQCLCCRIWSLETYAYKGYCSMNSNRS